MTIIKMKIGGQIFWASLSFTNMCALNALEKIFPKLRISGSPCSLENFEPDFYNLFRNANFNRKPFNLLMENAFQF